MNSRAQIRMLPDQRRLHLQDGPIDLIVEVFGEPGDVEFAYRAACDRFVTVLDELCSELTFLRRACSSGTPWPVGCVARRMTAAVMPFAAEYFITPIAAVAGAVADEILSAMLANAHVTRAYVNDGGDIALHLGEGQKFVAGMIQRPDRPSLFAATTIHSSDPVRGIATSGWRGRSFSLGIADAVTVLAASAAAADAAATIIANAVDLPGHPAIVRIPACELAPDSDLGERAVTQAVGDLTPSEVDRALAAGMETARRCCRIGLIHAVALHLRGETRVVQNRQQSILLKADAGNFEIERDAVRERGLVHA